MKPARGLMILLMGALLGCQATAGPGYVSPALSAGKVHRIAVTQVGGVLRGQPAAGQIADLFNIELATKGYQTVERANIDALLGEQAFQSSKNASPEGRARAGRILNVDAIVTVDVHEYGDKISMTAKMIDVEDGSLLWVQTGQGSTGKTLATVGGAAAGGALGLTLGGGRSGHIAGGLAGAGLGAVAGYQLSPRQVTQTQKIVHKICESLPPAAG